MRQDGTRTWEGHGRWCKSCGQYHGVIYRCPKYSDETLKEIEALTVKFKAQVENLRDPTVKAIFKTLGGYWWE